MKLHILRHAKTSESSPTGNDFDRELVIKGIKQAGDISHFLHKLDGVQIYCSAAKRAMQTLELLSSKLPTSNIHFSQDLYMATTVNLVQFINQIRHTKDILIIGHNNGISDLIAYLTGEKHMLKTCEYCCIDVTVKSWAELSKDGGKLTEVFRPIDD